MTTIEGICNQALDLIGYPRHIGNIYDGTKAARVALDAWAETRDALLSTVQPDWARTDTTLVELRAAPTGAYGPGTPWTTAYPPIPWLYEYAAPDDCLVPLMVKVPPTSLPVWRPRAIPFRANTDVDGLYTILANESPTILTCIKSVFDPNVWHEDFTEMVVQALARKFQVSLGKHMPQHQQEQKDANAA